ncbi:hypothetical protein ACFQVA_11195 [Actinomadura keratinilytica]
MASAPAARRGAGGAAARVAATALRRRVRSRASRSRVRRAGTERTGSSRWLRWSRTCGGTIVQKTGCGAGRIRAESAAVRAVGVRVGR